MSKAHDVAQEMIADEKESIKYWKKSIAALLEDGEDEYFMEKVHYLGEQIDRSSVGIWFLTKLLRKIDE